MEVQHFSTIKDGRFFVEINTDKHKILQAELHYIKQGNVMDIHHTFVPEELRGKGLAEKLAKSAFDYAKWLIQKKEFRKALGIFDVLLKVDPKDVQSEHLKNHLENLLKCLDIQKRVPFKFEDVMEALEGFEMTEYYLDIKTGDIIRISELESEEDKEQITEEDRYIYIESIPSFEKYKWMEQFINMIGHEKAKREWNKACFDKCRRRYNGNWQQRK